MNGIFARAPRLSMPPALALAAGAACAQAFPALPEAGAAALLGLASLLLGRARLGLPAAFLFGFAWALGAAWLRSQDVLPAEWERRDVLIEGEVLDVPDAIGRGGLRFGFRIDRAAAPLPGRVRLSWYKNAPPLKAGERWRLHASLKRPHGFANPGGMDYELWLFAQGVRATGHVRANADNQRLAEAGALSLPAWRQALHDRLSQALQGRPLAGVVAALTMGEESAITPGQWAVLRRTGTAHLVAVSGSHISLIAGLAYWLAWRVSAIQRLMGLPRHPLAAACALAAALLYAALAGFGIPTRRALIMVAALCAAAPLQRNIRPGATLALALAATILCDPLAVLSVGFWLSFGSVGLILLAFSGWLRPATALRIGNRRLSLPRASAGERAAPRPFWHPAMLWHRFMGLLRPAELWRVNWAVFLGLAPLMLLFFQQLSLASPFANLLAVPTIGLILTPLSLAGASLLAICQPAGEAVLGLAETLLGGVWQALEWLAGPSWAQWSHPAPPLWTLPFALAGVLLLLAPRGVPARWLGLVLLLPAVSFQPPPPAPGHFRLTLLDVGQGLAATVQTRNHLLVFDTGARFSQNLDAGSAVLAPFLRSLGLDKIDTLVVSHGDNDHIGGALPLLAEFPAGRILSSVPGRLAGAEGCRDGQRWEWDGVRFAMLAPAAALAGENNNSCVLRVSAAAGSALLTGDIERLAEQFLVERHGPALKSDVLIAPHHGSNTSSTAAFLAQVRPRQILIPAGYLNRFNFPHPAVLERYRAIGAAVYDTGQSGALSVEPGQGPPQAYRDTDGKYWNAR